MSSYTKIAARVLKMMKKRGRSLIIRRTTPGVYDPVTGSVGAPTIVDYPCWGVRQGSDSNSVSRYLSITTRTNSLIKQDDRIYFIASQELPIIPNPITDVIVVDGESFIIRESQELKPALVSLLHTLVVGK